MISGALAVALQTLPESFNKAFGIVRPDFKSGRTLAFYQQVQMHPDYYSQFFGPNEFLSRMVGGGAAEDRNGQEGGLSEARLAIAHGPVGG